MRDVSRRDAFKTLAAGAAVTAPVIALGTNRASAAAMTGSANAIPAHVAELIRQAAQKIATKVERRPQAIMAMARVMQCRSWEGRIYLYVDSSTMGFVNVNERALAIAAAAQAADRPVAVKVWGHDPGWASGAGRFDGALVALELEDLPAEPPSVV